MGFLYELMDEMFNLLHAGIGLYVKTQLFQARLSTKHYSDAQNHGEDLITVAQNFCSDCQKSWRVSELSP